MLASHRSSSSSQIYRANTPTTPIRPPSYRARSSTRAWLPEGHALLMIPVAFVMACVERWRDPDPNAHPALVTLTTALPPEAHQAASWMPTPRHPDSRMHRPLFLQTFTIDDFDSRPCCTRSAQRQALADQRQPSALVFDEGRPRSPHYIFSRAAGRGLR